MNRDLIQQFEAFYRNFGQADLLDLAKIYDRKITFVDPIHTVDGIEALTAYLVSSRANLIHCTFEFDCRALQEGQGFFQWRMHFAHPRVEAGRTQSLRGCSLIKIEYGKIVYHEDFYDLGAMLYEHIPVLGWVTRKIKRDLVSG